MNILSIYCCACLTDVPARLMDGTEIYPHRRDLHELPFWKCDHCGNFVGCHHKTKERTKPLGNIPTPEIKTIRRQIHAVIDPLWQQGKIPRPRLYAKMGEALGRPYHTGELKTEDEAMQMLRFAVELSRSML